MKLTFFKKEFFEFFRTYRFYVLFGIFIFFGILNAPIAKYLPELIKAIPDTGFNFEMPEPVLADSYIQFVSNASNAFFALIIVFMGSFSSEIKKGTIYLVLSKGISRFDFFISKILNAFLMYTIVYALYSLITIIATNIFFGEWFFDGIFVAITSYYLFGLLILSATLSASAIAKSAGPGAFAGFGILILIPMTELLGKFSDYLPGRLSSLSIQLIQGNAETGDILWPALASLLLMVLIITMSSLKFGKREL